MRGKNKKWEAFLGEPEDERKLNSIQDAVLQQIVFSIQGGPISIREVQRICFESSPLSTRRLPKKKAYKIISKSIKKLIRWKYVEAQDHNGRMYLTATMKAKNRYKRWFKR